MTEQEKIKRLKKHILKSKECFYDEGIDDYLYVKFCRLQELNSIYEYLTHERLFSELEVKLYNPIMYYFLLDQKYKFTKKSNIDTINNFKSLINENNFIMDYIDIFTNKTLNKVSDDLSDPVKLSFFQENYIINDYINRNFKYKNLYKEMNDDGRVMYVEDFPAFACASPSICDDNDYIFYSKGVNMFNQYSLMKAVIFIHEAMHIEDLRKVKESYGRNKMFDYSSSFFSETNSFLSELNYVKYLENLDVNEKVLNEIKKEVVSKCVNIPLRISVASILDINNMPPVILDSLFQDLRILYSFSSALLLEDASIDVKEKFDREKLITNDTTLFEGIGCDIKKILRKKI